MLQPTKFTNLDNSFLSFSSDMIEILINNPNIKYIELFNILKNDYNNSIDYYYILALDLLFVLGKIKYVKENDMLELIR